MSIFTFPTDFMWGAATSSYQIEGGWNADGKGPSIWDTFCRQPGAVVNGDTGDTACDSYHRLEEDLDLLAGLGATMYRFSVSWPRLYPQGRGSLNKAGLAYYDRLVDGLLSRGIQPFCTLYHWDLPQALQDQGGWEVRETADAFLAYADTMFRHFKGRIRHWITFNEPFCTAFVGNWWGVHAPGKKSMEASLAVAHHLLLAHGKTVRRFRGLCTQGQAEGLIGIAPNLTWAMPWTQAQADRDACTRAIQWSGDWFLDPVCFGHYPQELESWFKAKGYVAPVRDGDMAEIRQAVDFVGCNYYAARVHRHDPSAGIMESAELDMGMPVSDIGWPYEAAGFHDSLQYLRSKYGPIPLYITENGACINDQPGPDGRINDQRRIDYFRIHLAQLSRAIAGGVPVRGFMAWSLLDNFEWAEGYGKRFGLVHVDFATGRRIPKESYHWLSRVYRKGRLGTGSDA